LNYLAPVPTSGSTVASNVDFYLGDASQSADAGYPSGATYSGSLQSALVAGTFTTNVALTTRKFIVPFQGGFDGARPNLKKYSGKNITATNTFGFDCSSATATGTIAYNKAFNLLANTDYYDINMLLTPGIIESLHPVVTQNARNLVENRQDAFYVMDSNNIDAPITEVVATAATLDSSYTATYWPWVRIINPDRNIPVWVPASVVMPGVLAFNDQVAAPWYAPAGLTRGGLTSVSDTYTILSQDKRNTLYEARVNPIANFPNEGICVWGQKTLQARPSALDRVNVRRLLITVKKFIASSTKYLVFEQNTTQTRNRFLAIANPYMEQVKAQQGLYAFRVVMDQTNNTPDLIDQNILYGQLFLQPTRTAEFIILDFNIQPTGASFPE
jgi:phage tail sheath protein FI